MIFVNARMDLIGIILSEMVLVKTALKIVICAHHPQIVKTVLTIIILILKNSNVKNV